MKRKIMIMIWLGLLSGTILQAQPSGTRWQVGDTVPDVTLKMINYKSGTARLSDFRGRFLILDFWSTYCLPCVAQFPKLEALQQNFGEQLMILPVTGYKDAAYNKAFFAQMEKKGLPITLPSVVEDTVLWKGFGVTGLPHAVWINEAGVVQSITDDSWFSEANIRRALTDDQLQLPQKITVSGFDRNKPLLVGGNGGPDSAFVYRSLFTPYLPGISSKGFRQQQDSLHTRLFLSNQTAIGFYKNVFKALHPEQAWLSLDYYNKRVQVEGTARRRLVNWTDINTSDGWALDSFKQRHLYSYELVLPPSFTLQQAYRMMIRDGNQFFGLEVSVEKRKVPVLALVRTSGKDKIRSSGGISLSSATPDKLQVSLRNMPLDVLVTSLNAIAKVPLIVNETGYKGPIDLELVFRERHNIAAIREALARYDLGLVEKVRSLDVLVLGDQQE